MAALMVVGAVVVVAPKVLFTMQLGPSSLAELTPLIVAVAATVRGLAVSGTLASAARLAPTIRGRSA